MGLKVVKHMASWVKKMPTLANHRFWSIFPFTNCFFWAPFFDPQPYALCSKRVFKFLAFCGGPLCLFERYPVERKLQGVFEVHNTRICKSVAQAAPRLLTNFSFPARAFESQNHPRDPTDRKADPVLKEKHQGRTNSEKFQEKSAK